MPKEKSIKEELDKRGFKEIKENNSKPKARQIIIETDGNNINLVKNETAGVLELMAVLQTILTKLTQQK